MSMILIYLVGYEIEVVWQAQIEDTLVASLAPWPIYNLAASSRWWTARWRTAPDREIFASTMRIEHIY